MSSNDKTEKGNMIQTFNMNLKNMLFALMEEAEKRELVYKQSVKYYYLKLLQNSDSKVDSQYIVCELSRQKSIEEQGEYLGYYWAEYENEYGMYKLCMFYKDFDHASGNIHVLPGWIQLWKKCCKSSKFFFINQNESSIYKKIKKTYGSGTISTYCEEGWKPVWSNTSMNINIVSPIWNIYNGVQLKKHTYDTIVGQIWNYIYNVGNCSDCCLYPKVTNKDIKEYYKKICSEICNDSSLKKHGRGKYSLIKWNILEGIIKINYKMLFVQGHGFFCYL